jgi:ribosome-binding factor A
MEDRQRQHRRERMADALRDEIIALLEGELGDPRIGLASVSEVLLAPDGRSARIFIHVAGSEQDAENTLEALVAATGHIRHELGTSLALRKVPELHFQLDRSEQNEARVDELLGRIKKRK